MRTPIVTENNKTRKVDEYNFAFSNVPFLKFGVQIYCLFRVAELL